MIKITDKTYVTVEQVTEIAESFSNEKKLKDGTVLKAIWKQIKIGDTTIHVIKLKAIKNNEITYDNYIDSTIYATRIDGEGNKIHCDVVATL